jgi:2-aminoadipate transaminase
MTIPHGGYYLWLTLPKEINGDELAKASEKEGLVILAGSKFFAGGAAKEGQANHCRVAYSHASLEEIDEGVRRLARALQSLGR